MVFGRSGQRHIERRLRSIGAELIAARERVEVATQQYQAFVDEDEDAAVRALTSEQVGDRRVADSAHRHAELMRSAIDRARADVAALERSRDELLSRYQPGGDQR